jgi:multicomponent Na+:H+ antiporter subunit D
MFLVSALSLVGIPPLSGFVAKFGLIDAGVAEGQYAVVAVGLVVSLLTLFAMTRIWMGAFWSPAEASPGRAPAVAGRGGGPFLMVLPTAVLVVVGLAVAAAAGPLYALSERTARDLLDRDAYIDEVLGR